jgi:hypothetical protein
MSWRTSALLAALLSGCATSNGAEQQAALLAAPDAASRAAIQQAAAKLVGHPVALADDAFTRESMITIERSAARDPSGRRIEARETSMPTSLRLVQRGTACILVQDETNKEVALDGVKCVTPSK